MESVLLYLPVRGDFDMCRRYQMPDNVEPFQPTQRIPPGDQVTPGCKGKGGGSPIW